MKGNPVSSQAILTAGQWTVETAGELSVVEKEIKRLHSLQYEKCYQRYHYRCLRHRQEAAGIQNGRETKLRDNGENKMIAVPETMIKAALRRLGSKESGMVKASDIMVKETDGSAPLEVCLLVDTSGSMNGRRIKEVRNLAAHLVQHMHEPLSLVTFQEGDVGVKIRATRDSRLLHRGLSAMSAAGLTPLGDGIRAALNYLTGRRGKTHLIILVTDGLPTWAQGDRDPYLDALEAGAQLKQKKIKLLCIGLEPQRQFLERLAAAANASLYIVEDLEHRELAAITRREAARVKCE